MRVAWILLGLVAATAVSAQAQVAGFGGADANQIYVANHSVTPVKVYVEDAEGREYQLGRVDRGQTTMFEASEDLPAEGEFRVLVRPCEYRQFSTDPVSVGTKALQVDTDRTVVLWLERDLTRSKVEVRQS